MVYTHSFLSYNESSDWNDGCPPWDKAPVIETVIHAFIVVFVFAG
jgi:hypothetical protein|nr:MAG TPA: hypothetical protein [Caudoviricetes sp.]